MQNTEVFFEKGERMLFFDRCFWKGLFLLLILRLFDVFSGFWLINLRDRNLVGDTDRDSGDGEQSKAEG